VSNLRLIHFRLQNTPLFSDLIREPTRIDVYGGQVFRCHFYLTDKGGTVVRVPEITSREDLPEDQREGRLGVIRYDIGYLG
jgi:hypothetical protein